MKNRSIILFLISIIIGTQFCISQNNNLELLGSISGQTGILKMSKNTLIRKFISAKSILKPQRYEVIKYKIKINYDQIFVVKGYRITDDIKEYLDYTKRKSKVEIYDIIVRFKKETYTNVKPIIIYLTD